MGVQMAFGRRMNAVDSGSKYTGVAKAATSISLLIAVFCVLVAARYYFWMVRDGFIGGQGKKVMEDGIEFGYFGIVYLGLPALIGIVTSFWSGPARRVCIPASLVYPLLFGIYIALVETFF
jgi:hypothetical protein